jgi:hypothetical protein
MLQPAISDMVKYQTTTVSKKLVRDCVVVMRKFENELSLIPADQLRAIIDGTIRVIQNNPGRIERIHRKTERLNTQYVVFARSVLRTDLTRLTNARLIKLYARLNWFARISHGYAIATLKPWKKFP